MCGHDLRIRPRRRQRVSWVDTLLVLAVLAVLAFWWQIASQPQAEQGSGEQALAILPTNIPLMTDTPTPTATVEAPPTATPVPTAAGVTTTTTVRHRVRPGETLLSIATFYGVTVEEIQAANGLTSELIRADDELLIPVTRTEGTASSNTVASRFEYTVQAGDTIISIANQFGSTVQEILAANNLAANDVIRPGDVLIVPVPQLPTEVLASSPATPTASADGGSPNGGNTLTPAIVDTIYIEPRLLGPPDGAVLPRNESVLLRWISVDLLAPNEWYVLLIYPSGGAAQTIPSIWTKATSYRLGIELAPPAGQEASYAWQVSVVRVKPGRSGEQLALEAASPPSEVRNFTWR